MAFIPSKRAQNAVNQIAKEPNIILEIEGIPVIFGSQPTETLWRFDEGFELDTPGLRFDSTVPDPNARDFISIEGGTSKTISQQVSPDKGGRSSSLRDW